MTKIGIFGGSFDPFTAAHMAIVEKVLESNIVDSVTIVPTIVDYHRPGKDRWLDAAGKFTAMNAFVKRSAFIYRIYMDFQELSWKQNGVLSEEAARNWRFVDTLSRMKKTYDASYGENYRFYAILGTDSLASFKTWHRWEDILSMATIVGVQGRDGKEVNPDFDYIPVRIADEYSEMSSSRARERFGNVKEYLNYVFGEKS